MKLAGIIIGALVGLASLLTAGIGVWTRLEDNRIAARAAYTDGLAATEKAYRALNERMIGVEARLDVLMHGHGAPAPPERRPRAWHPPEAPAALQAAAAQRRKAAPSWKAVMGARQ